jgi:hypothetical protein
MACRLQTFQPINASIARKRLCEPELVERCSALTLAMETIPDHEPEVDVYQAPNGVLTVVIPTGRQTEPDPSTILGTSQRRAPKRVH